jgi:hypothetical protein
VKSLYHPEAKSTTRSAVFAIGAMIRHRKPKHVTAVASSSAPIASGSGSRSGASKTHHDSNAPSSAIIDALISQLLDHVHQGRIFDARSIVMKLNAAEKADPKNCSPNLGSVRHVMEEVLTQSQHVEDLLCELHSDDNWTLAKHKSGVTVHFRREPNSSIHTVRAATTFDHFSPKDFVRFCSLFVETELMHMWFPGHFMQPANVLSWHSKYSKVNSVFAACVVFVVDLVCFHSCIRRPLCMFR